jgi:DNA-binding beta-propeller fold protein YncE
MNEIQSHLNPVRVLFFSLIVFASVAAFAVSRAEGEIPTVPTWGGPGNGLGQFDTPKDVAVAPGLVNDVYIVDSGNFRIQRFSPAGQYLDHWGSPGTGAGQFGVGLKAVAVAPDGKAFVLDDRGTGGGFRVQRFGSDGAFELGWGSAEGSALGEFDEPTDIAVGPDGRVYVTEAGNHRVQSFDSDGSDPAAWGELGNGGGKFADPVGIAVDQDSGDVFVADGGATPQVQVFSESGEFIREWGETGIETGKFPAHGLIAIAVADGDVYTRDTDPTMGDRFQRFTPAGALIASQYWNDFTASEGLAVQGDGMYAPDPGGNRIHAFDLRQPTPGTLGPITEVLAGQTVTFESTSSVPLGQIVDHEWDLDGNGTYETDTGLSPAVQHTYFEAGIYSVGLRVTSDRGGIASETRRVEVVLAPLPGPPGVSINDGAPYTRDPNVRVTVQWPIFSRHLTIANDGGFAPAKTMAVQRTVSWRLDTGGPQRQARTIYVRFGRFDYVDEVTYTDDIYLDTVKPTVRVVEVPVSDGPPQLRLMAKDKVSGVASMQLKRNGKQQGWRAFKKALRLRFGTKGLRVRVRDKAGNLSRWMGVRRPR